MACSSNFIKSTYVITVNNNYTDSKNVNTETKVLILSDAELFDYGRYDMEMFRLIMKVRDALILESMNYCQQKLLS
jgi:hypothetical protein